MFDVLQIVLPAGSQQLIAEFEALRTAVECQTSAVQNQTSLLKEFMADHSSQTIDASKVTAEEVGCVLKASCASCIITRMAARA